VTNIQTSADAAKALEPLAGKFAFILFAAGIIGTGLLALPVLAGSAAYALGETLGWPWAWRASGIRPGPSTAPSRSRPSSARS
jgi:Mn2+ and Fe2+ transporters of the NRAMP family